MVQNMRLAIAKLIYLAFLNDQHLTDKLKIHQLMY